METAIAHARGFTGAVDGPPALLVDLGSGGGLPGLVLAATWNATSVVLVEANQRRSEFLRAAVATLDLGDRVVVLAERAEEVGRDPALRGRAELVVARGFGPPAVTAECGAPLLQVGGRLVVSEPPGGGGAERWPTGPLAELGLVVDRSWGSEFHYQSLRQVTPCPERYPRRVGVPTKRPLY